MAPWLIRQLLTFGQLSPSTASGKVLYLRSIAEWNSITTPATLEYLLGQGMGPLVQSRIGGLIAAIAIFATLVGGLVLTPFLVIGAWRRRRSLDFGPAFVYALCLFAFSALVSAVHVPGGTFIHSAVALAPHSYVLAIEGILAATAWVAARRSGWNAERAGRVFIVIAVGLTTLLAVVGAAVVQGQWTVERGQRQAVSRALAAVDAPASDRLMTIDAAGYRYYTGRGGVVLVNDPLATIEGVARAYAVRWLVVERDDAVAAMAPVLAGERPAWIGAPIFEIPSPDGSIAAVAVYPVCVAPADSRCSDGE